MSEFQTVARIGDIPLNEGRSYVVSGRMVGVFHVDDGYYAINDICPHMGASLAAGPVEGMAVMCPWHAWRFSICDGSWLDAPKSKVRTETYEVRIAGDEIQVRIPDPPPRPADAPT
jgi:nitrite reductase (NADH) small subunit/3-phenylpropionate/trans-cinnamate dioxygenase ferredoxin subunit